MNPPVDELFRRRMHFTGPKGFEPCTRDWPHEGPCAHPSSAGPSAEFVIDFIAWLERRDATGREYGDALPCLDPSACRGECKNCRLVREAVEAIAGPPPHFGDYRPEET